jgi:phage baseplate assembly protein W
VSDVVRDMIAAELALLELEVRAPEGNLGYGVDVVCRTDVTPRLDELDPFSVAGIGQALLHRLSTPRGKLPDDRDYGRDLQQYLSQPTDAVALRRYAGEISAECAKDDRVADADVTLTMSDAKNMRVQIVVEPRDPELSEFTLILAVTNGQTLLEDILQ